jgi:hypothetical protein
VPLCQASWPLPTGSRRQCEAVTGRTADAGYVHVPASTARRGRRRTRPRCLRRTQLWARTTNVPSTAPASPPAGGPPRGGGFECERVSRCKKYRTIGVRDVLGPGGHLGLRAAQVSRMRVSSATALRPKMPSPLANAPSLSPETVRRGGEQDRCATALLGGSNPVTTRIVRRVSRKHFAVLHRGSDQHFRHR